MSHPTIKHRAGHSQPLRFKVSHVNAGEGCEDFANEPIGRLYPDGNKFRFSSGLNIQPMPARGAPVNAMIVALGAGRALSYQQAAEDNMAWNAMVVGIHNVDSPLSKPMTVTVEFEVLNPTFRLLDIHYAWSGGEPISILISPTAGRFSLGYPAGARVDTRYGAEGFTFRIVRHGEDYGPSSGTVRIKSVCWKQ
ncbi:hypothetical protein GCM10011247_10770 [Pseudomonas plecoglossicida]|nr:hypothetical protein GCM10011247_10770 [Pseudomonas plecoglossicida]